MPHWSALQEAIAVRGLSALVSEGGEKAVSNLADEAERGRTIDNYDPLMAAHNAIVSNVMGFVGLELMRPNEDGSERCPLCFLTAVHAANCTEEGCSVTTYDHWVDRAADDQVEEWKRLTA